MYICLIYIYIYITYYKCIYIYIYICTHIHTYTQWLRGAARRRASAVPRRGQRRGLGSCGYNAAQCNML